MGISYKQTKIKECYKRLRDNGYGRDTWPSFEVARLIAEACLPSGDLIDRVIAMEGMSKGKKFKDLTVDEGSFHKAPKWSKEDEKVLYKFLPLNQSERARWLRSDAFISACQTLNWKHPGEVATASQRIMKRFRKGNDKSIKIYINYHPDYHTSEEGIVKIGMSKYGGAKRIEDSGSHAYGWHPLGEIEGFSDSQVKKMLKPWNHKCRWGTEAYKLDPDACSFIKKHLGFNIYAHNISLPWREVSEGHSQLDIEELSV